MTGKIGEILIADKLDDSFVINSDKPFLGTASSFDADKTLYHYDSFGHVRKKVVAVAHSMKSELRMERRSVVGICGSGPSWLFCDFACAYNDFIVVGLHENWDVSTLIAIVQNASISCIICGDCHTQKFLEVGACSSVKDIVLMGANNSEAQQVQSTFNIRVHSLINFERLGLEAIENGTVSTWTGAGIGLPRWMGISNGELQSNIQKDDCDDVHTIIYTSGTTGVPKGVAITKRRWIRDAESNPFLAAENPTMLSYMALAHGGDRGLWYIQKYKFSCIKYLPNINIDHKL